MRKAVLPLCGALVLLVGACARAPEYRKPDLTLPADWRIEAPWRVGTPADDAPKGPWWTRFGDPDLNRLELAAQAGSPTLAAAQARLTQARSVLAGASASLWPQFGIAARDNRFRIASARPLTNLNTPNQWTTQQDMAALLTVSYEIDLFGRVDSAIQGARASAQQSAADFENVRLVLSADIATAYFNLRAIDIELDVLSRSIELQRRALGLARSRYELGQTSGLDVAQQQATLDSTLTQVDVLARTRAQFQNALATLTGTPAPVFEIAPRVISLLPPAVPLGVPSDVLERRPDVASAERAMAAANAQIGVANAAFFPSVALGGNIGTQSRTTGLLFSTPAYIWSLGATLAATLFDGGRIKANSAAVQAAYDATVANYRRVVLTAMQEVEDGILGLAALERAHAQAQTAITSATRVLELANARYEGGVATSLDVITAQQSLLNTQRLAAQLQGQRLLTAVFLVKALGGDWEGARSLGSL